MRRTAVAAALLGAVFAVTGCSSAATQGSESPSTTPAATGTKPEQPAERLTVAQQNAARKAESYLDLQGFSRSGLIKQLKFEKFSTKDATVAVDSIKVNWNEQAAKKAQAYMDTQGFSRDGLIKQLKFEGFTQAQAAHGAKSVGL